MKFVADKGHAIIPSAPVVPEHDPTTLFNIAGMQPLTPYLLGEPHPAGKRLADIQKCIRTIDLDEVGDSSHNTFMEMLGWWSLGDYFKDFTIEMTWELFTKAWRLPVEKLAATVFVGDDNAPRDEESAGIWKGLGMPVERIFYCAADDNWWGPAGQTGPCGPSTEIFYWTGEGEPEGRPDEDDRWLELGNNVLMSYEKTAEGAFLPLKQQNVDTGLGFERIVGALQGAANVYETDLFQPILATLTKLAGNRLTRGLESDETLRRAHRIIADHLKAATFMIADGVRPSNVEQGYVLRRLIRRAIRQARHLEIEYPFTKTVAETVIENFREAYPELDREGTVIREELLKEEEKFHRLLTRGLREVESLIEKNETIDGAKAFYFFETHGFPVELTLEELKNHHRHVDEAVFLKDFQTAQQAHQDKSRAGAEQKFAGGLADTAEQTIKLHTATHLLNAALKDVLGDHVKQRGSNITAERLRFDFSHSEKLTDEEVNQVEALVNEWIKEDLPVIRKEMPKEEAERIGAQMEFGHKYPDIVSVYFVGEPASARSIEFCGGPHVGQTGEIGAFKIQKQESVGAGLRRIKAVVG